MKFLTVYSHSDVSIILSSWVPGCTHVNSCMLCLQNVDIQLWLLCMESKKKKKFIDRWNVNTNNIQNKMFFSISVHLYFVGYLLCLIVCHRFSIPSLNFFLSSRSPHSPFLKDHILVGFKEFHSLVCWCTVIHHHQSQGPILF